MEAFDEYVTQRIDSVREDIAKQIEDIDLNSRDFQSLNALGMKLIVLKIVRGK